MEPADNAESQAAAKRPGAVLAAIWIEFGWLLACGALWLADVTVLRPVGGSLRTQGTEACGTFGIPMLFALAAVVMLRHRDAFGWWWCVVGNTLLFLALVPYVSIVPLRQALPAACLLALATLSTSAVLLLPDARRYFAGD